MRVREFAPKRDKPVLSQMRTVGGMYSTTCYCHLEVKGDHDIGTGVSYPLPAPHLRDRYTVLVMNVLSLTVCS